MNKNVSTIILCGGRVDPSNLPIGTNVSNATIPVNGKPVIAWILDDLLEKGFRRAIVVVRSEDEKLQNFLKRTYSQKMQIIVALVDDPKSILESLDKGLNSSEDENPTQIILGDTLIRDAFNFEIDAVYIGRVDDAKRWCLAVTDNKGQLVELIDKEEDKHISYYALAGYYFFVDTVLLKHCVKESLKSGERELSAAIRRYMQKRSIKTYIADEWYDFGHIDNLIHAKRRLLKPRYFNYLSINPVLNTITKVSDNSEKLIDELDWYLHLPDELKVLTPRILHQEKQDGKIKFVQEYYGYPTLAELYVYSDLHYENWRLILRNLLKIHQEFRKYRATMPESVLTEMYVAKTEERLSTLTRNDKEWKALLNEKEIMYNGKVYQNYWMLIDFLRALVEEMKRDFTPCIIHGDLCFSNILYDVSNQIIRLIDPRGSFGVKGIYGDPRYDIAKLRHSVAGMYDFIVADMFEVKKNNDAEFEAEAFGWQSLEPVIADFDLQIEKAGYNIQHIKLIEGLLFVSMLPLHSDYPKRQLMMFLTGIKRLNEVRELYECAV